MQFRSIAIFLILLAGPAMAFDIEAHRGGRGLFPENTLVSFAGALTMGVDTLELDLASTSDGVLVVSHERRLNPDLARDANGAYVVPPGAPFATLPLAEVKTYDVGQIRPDSNYAKQFPEQRAVPHTPIPTLKEVIDLVRSSGNEHVRLNIETKIDPDHLDESPDPERFVTLLLGVLDAEQFSDRVMIQSFDWRTLQLVQQRAPKIPTVYLTLQRGMAPNVSLTRVTHWTAGFNPADHGGSLPRTIHAAGGKVWSPYFADVTPELVKQAHDLDLRVVVWTVNKPEDIARLIDMGVDGIISDRPDVLTRIAIEKGVVKSNELRSNSTAPK